MSTPSFLAAPGPRFLAVGRLLLVSVLCGRFPIGLAQSPESITIQGILADADGNPIEAGSAELTVLLYDAESGGSPIWGSSGQTVPLDHGVYALTFGGAGLAGIDFSQPLWVAVSVGGEILAPRRPLTGAPYALATRGFRVVLNASADGPNIAGGHPGNEVGGGQVGATISGGGQTDEGVYPEGGYNRVVGDYGTVGGGAGNQACSQSGHFNGEYCTVGGGRYNYAYDAYTTIAGGRDNIVSYPYGSVGGGYDNLAAHTATVPGGERNEATGSHSLAAGYRARANHAGAFVWNDRSQTSGTDADNFVSTAQNQFLVRAAGGVGINTNSPVTGGLTVNGQIESRLGSYKFPDGTVQYSAGWGVTGNAGTTPGPHFIGTIDPVALEMKVGGLRVWKMTPYPADSGPNLIGGHYANAVSAGVVGATIAGGGTQDVHNRVTGNYGAVVGGVDNSAGSEGFVGSGISNAASGYASVVAGGDGNRASGGRSAVPGGADNVAAGDYSFAAGRYANAAHSGSFVWADASEMKAFSSTGTNQFLVKANGGIKLVRGSDGPQSTAAALQVESNAGSETVWIKQHTSNTTGDGGPAVMALLKHPESTNSYLSGYVQDPNAGSGTVRKFHITSAGTFVAGSDIAEALPAASNREELEPGDVLVISRSTPGAVERSAQRYDPAVIGVYSTRPGFLGADKGGVTEVWESDVPVAIAGIVPVKVTDENGPIRPGDPLTTSSVPGHAMRASSVVIGGIPSYPSGVLIGKAMEGFEGGAGVIRMFVMCQ